VGDEDDRLALLVLSSLPGLTPRRLRSMAEEVGGAAACLAAARIGHRLVNAPDRELAERLRPEDMAGRLDDVGARMAVPGDDDFPDGVLDLPDPPAALFVRGRTMRLEGPVVAMVGARNCSALGAEVARAFGSGLAGAGACVVSGGARGIDSASHEGALAVGGPTVAVLGSGIDVAYPNRSRALLDRILEAGSVVSEYPPGVPAQPFRFPARNRIVASMADAVLIVEGATGSGSLITADFALDLGRPVFAVPGPVTSPLSEVPLGLIRDGAGLVRNAEDLLADLGHLDPSFARTASADPGGLPRAPALLPGDLSELERRVAEALAGPTLPEVLAANLDSSLGEVLTAVIGLELRGLARTVGGRVELRLPGGDA
jgi:DNA processing protein